ncbi:MAG: hypothetical protein AVDCRST_MAG06-2111, partial [uncultured Nocardioides sp.]
AHVPAELIAEPLLRAHLPGVAHRTGLRRSGRVQRAAAGRRAGHRVAGRVRLVGALRGRRGRELAERVPPVLPLPHGDRVAGAGGVTGVQAAGPGRPGERRGPAGGRPCPARLTRLGASRRLADRALLALPRAGDGVDLPGQLGRPGRVRLGGLQRGPAGRPPGPGQPSRLPARAGLLEPHPAELAVGVPRRRVDGRARRVPARARVAGEQAGRSAARLDRRRGL